jgi:hypothetical protein
MASAGDPAVILCKLEPEEAAAPTPGDPGALGHGHAGRSGGESAAMTDVGRMSVGELVSKVLADEHADVLRQAGPLPTCTRKWSRWKGRHAARNRPNSSGVRVRRRSYPKTRSAVIAGLGASTSRTGLVAISRLTSPSNTAISVWPLADPLLDWEVLT